MGRANMQEKENVRVNGHKEVRRVIEGRRNTGRFSIAINASLVTTTFSLEERLRSLLTIHLLRLDQGIRQPIGFIGGG